MGFISTLMLCEIRVQWYVQWNVLDVTKVFPYGNEIKISILTNFPSLINTINTNICGIGNTKTKLYIAKTSAVFCDYNSLFDLISCLHDKLSNGLICTAPLKHGYTALIYLVSTLLCQKNESRFHSLCSRQCSGQRSGQSRKGTIGNERAWVLILGDSYCWGVTRRVGKPNYSKLNYSKPNYRHVSKHMALFPWQRQERKERQERQSLLSFLHRWFGIGCSCFCLLIPCISLLISCTRLRHWQGHVEKRHKGHNDAHLDGSDAEVPLGTPCSCGSLRSQHSQDGCRQVGLDRDVNYNYIQLNSTDPSTGKNVSKTVLSEAELEMKAGGLWSPCHLYYCYILSEAKHEAITDKVPNSSKVKLEIVQLLWSTPPFAIINLTASMYETYLQPDKCQNCNNCNNSCTPKLLSKCKCKYKLASVYFHNEMTVREANLRGSRRTACYLLHLLNHYVTNEKANEASPSLETVKMARLFRSIFRSLSFPFMCSTQSGWTSRLPGTGQRGGCIYTGQNAEQNKKTLKTSNRRQCVSFCCFSCKRYENKFWLIAIYFVNLLDRIGADKGRVLYAPPALLAEHYVFLLNLYNKGGTISFARFNTQSLISKLLKINLRHAKAIIELLLINDVEPNPGPRQAGSTNCTTTVVSLNCRGLGSMDKTRLLLNKIYAMPRSQRLIVMQLQVRHRSEHVKLDNAVVQDKETLSELITYVNEQMLTAAGMNPHVKLEFAKMTIRTKALDIMSRCKRKENERLKEINDCIKENMRLLTVYWDVQSHMVLANELEDLDAEKAQILTKQGETLAHRAKTRWYNEGERSNKYFLNLLKRNREGSEMSALNVEEREITEPEQVRDDVTQFYQKLYNKDESALECDDRFLDAMFQVDGVTNEAVGAPGTLEELWLTLKPTKATTPGPDGLSNTYLKKLWTIMGPLIVDAWNFSILTGVLPPSHKTSLLRLIPKAGKDKRLLKNWRPITLSHCDHKLVTRLYNNRVLKAISNDISLTQTAYLKGRSIGNNLRLLNAVNRVASYEENVNATVIALDAQKAFDSVSHQYIVQVLNHVGLTRMVPIFKLLYKDLSNDIIINGRIGKGYKINNGVKQGDALSCSLFILAMEPLIRNITNNATIKAVKSDPLNFTWPKVVAYADDVTVVTHNENQSVGAIFTEYNRLTKASGLMLNADKTEKYDIYSANVVRPVRQLLVRYGAQSHTLMSQRKIKLNGILFERDIHAMRQANYEIMLNKMTSHFKDWQEVTVATRKDTNNKDLWNIPVSICPGCN
jgi:hypothetical protein